MMSEKVKIGGWVGVIYITIAYVLITFEVIESQSVFYNALNLMGGILIAVRVWHDKNYSNFVLEIVFIIIAIIGIIKNL